MLAVEAWSAEQMLPLEQQAVDVEVEQKLMGMKWEENTAHQTVESELPILELEFEARRQVEPCLSNLRLLLSFAEDPGRADLCRTCSYRP